MIMQLIWEAALPGSFTDGGTTACVVLACADAFNGMLCMYIY